MAGSFVFFSTMLQSEFESSAVCSSLAGRTICWLTIGASAKLGFTLVDTYAVPISRCSSTSLAERRVKIAGPPAGTPIVEVATDGELSA